MHIGEFFFYSCKGGLWLQMKYIICMTNLIATESITTCLNKIKIQPVICLQMDVGNVPSTPCTGGVRVQSVTAHCKTNLIATTRWETYYKIKI